MGCPLVNWMQREKPVQKTGMTIAEKVRAAEAMIHTDEK